VRTLLLLLVAPTLLMPPGMCICQFVPCGGEMGTGRGNLAAALRQSSQTAKSGTCTCEKSRSGSHGLRSIGAPTCQDHAVASGGEKPCPCPGTPWPGCPAVTGEDQAKVAPESSPVLSSLDLACDFVRFAEVPAVRVAPIDFTSLRPAHSPLFISQCTLLI
jgi:hypothetical protein